MSNTPNSVTSKLRLPEGREIEIVLVELEDGRMVGRTREEIELQEKAAPPGGSGNTPSAG